RHARARHRPIHLASFTYLHSTCAACLPPIGDPPLYLGYLKGVPFFWTLAHLWTDWLLLVGLLLGAFLAYDTLVERHHRRTFSPLPTTAEAGNLMEAEIDARPGLRLRGVVGLVCLGLMIAGVFVDPILERFTGFHGFPV